MKPTSARLNFTTRRDLAKDAFVMSASKNETKHVTAEAAKREGRILELRGVNMSKNDRFTKTEFVIYKVVLAFNNRNLFPTHQQIYEAVSRNFPEIPYAHETISRVTRRMVEFGNLIKHKEGFQVPIALRTDKSTNIEEQHFLKEWSM